ncbi:hypothetical protein H4582DRAFT_382888 [Lactarius indigo]|nr:hypothetical protein H4582DRAFT_382888 [Lactarius indigo]
MEACQWPTFITLLPVVVPSSTCQSTLASSRLVAARHSTACFCARHKQEKMREALGVDGRADTYHYTGFLNEINLKHSRVGSVPTIWLVVCCHAVVYGHQHV